MTFASEIYEDTKEIVEGEFSVEFTFREGVHKGIFDKTYVEVDPGGDVNIATNNPRLTFPKDILNETQEDGSVIFKRLIQGETIVINGVSYQINSHIEYDESAGLAIIYLTNDYANSPSPRDAEFRVY